MKSYVKIRAEGLNLDRQLDKMIKSGITVKDISRPYKKIIEFCVPYSQKNNALAFFPAECYNIIIIKTGGIAALRQFAARRAALVVCLLVFTASLFALSGFIWRVEIETDGDRAAVSKALEESGFFVGTHKSGVNLDEAENALCNKLPDIKYAIVSVKGCTLFVKTYAKEKPSDVVDLNKPNSIYAQSDGVVSRILVVSGTARVSVGDEVKKGQLLIEGVRTFPDQSTEPTCAVGEVYVIVGKKGRSRFEDYKTTLVKTGEYKRFFSLSLFNFSTAKDAPKAYDEQIAETKTAKLFPLPVVITTITVYKATTVREKQDFEKHREACKQEALADALAQLGGTAYTDIVYSEIKCDGGVIVEAEVFAEVRADGYADIT